MPNSERLRYEINSIFGGHQPTSNFGGEGQYSSSLGIDLERPLGTPTLPSGGVTPTRYTDFTTSLAGAPMFISGAHTTPGVYVVDDNGSAWSYSAALGSETAIGGVPLSEGNGMVAYNDYMYMASGTDIHRYGQLSATAPAFGAYWAGTLGQSSLTDTEYPSTRNVEYPNHPLYMHNDGALYVGDYDGNGRIHRFRTDSDGTNGWAEWDVLTLPPAHMPMDFAHYNDDLAIVVSPEAKYASGDIPRTENAKLVLWSTVPGEQPYRFIDTGEAIASAVVNFNGQLIVFAGNIDAGCRVLRYIGGESFEKLTSVNEGSPPPHGAVDIKGDCLAWGGHVTYPSAAAGCFTVGHRSFGLPSVARHHIGRISNTTGTLPIVSCLKFLKRTIYPVMGWRTDTAAAYGIDSLQGTGTTASVWRSQVFHVGKKFTINRLKFPLSHAIAANMTVTPTIYVDNEVASYTAGEAGLLAVNNTNYTSSQRLIDQRGLTVQGEHSFVLELAFSGTAEFGVGLPIEIELDRYDT